MEPSNPQSRRFSRRNLAATAGIPNNSIVENLRLMGIELDEALGQMDEIVRLQLGDVFR